MIKSLQVIRRFVFSEWGGTESVVWNTAQELNRTGNPVEILATQALDKTKNETREGINIRRFKYFYPYLNLNESKTGILDRKGGDPYSRELYEYMLKAEGINIIHCHTMNRIAASVRLAARKRKIPYLISFHGGHFDVPAQEMALMTAPYRHTFNYGRLIDLIIKKQRYLQDAAAIICVGYNEYEISKERYPDKLVYYLPNGVDIEKFSQPLENDFKKKYHIPETGKIILCLSRLDYQKNQKLLVELMDRIRSKKPEAHLVLMGPVTSQTYFDELQSMIKRLKLNERITIIKGVQANDPDLVKAYQSAEVFILPSIHEPFGIVALEAWASGVPVIASAVGGLKKLVSDGKTGLLFDGSLPELAEKYLLLNQNKALAKELCRNALQEVRSEYSWQSVTGKLLEYYQEIIAQYGKGK
jgi:glycosyltransferase involved in cell wall biosynthesis